MPARRYVSELEAGKPTCQIGKAITVAVELGIVIDQPSRSPLPMIGAITGGAFVLVGFLCWGKASSLQSDIDDAPANTPADFDAIKELERSADSYAGAGNFLFVAGAVLGGFSAYYLVKNRRKHASTTALIGPALFDHGAGIAITGSTP